MIRGQTIRRCRIPSVRYWRKKSCRRFEIRVMLFHESNFVRYDWLYNSFIEITICKSNVDLGSEDGGVKTSVKLIFKLNSDWKIKPDKWDSLAKHRGKFSRSWTIRYTTAICLPLHSRDSRWLDDSPRLVIIQVSWFITRGTVMVYARRGGGGEINWNKLDARVKTLRNGKRGNIFEARVPFFIRVEMEVLRDESHSALKAETDSQFPTADVIFSSKRELGSQRATTKERDSPPWWGSDHHRRWRGVKGTARRSRDETKGGGGKGWERMGGKRIKVFRSRKLFMAATFTVFFVAAVNEARFLITPGCSMILL